MDFSIEELWDNEQAILDIIDSICRKNNLRYSIAFGTLLGAVRHGGFIPWDDDIDIIMPREDYETLLRIWNTVAPQGFILQDYHTDPDSYTNNFAKIRKDHTTFLQLESERNSDCHKGIFIDIFPGDRYPDSALARKYQKAMIAINLLYSRGYTSKSGILQNYVERLFLSLPLTAKKRIRLWAEKNFRRWNGNSKLSYVFPCTIRDASISYRPDIFDNLTELDFRGKKYLAVRDYDSFLKTVYGDYMKLPPLDERVWKHKPLIVDFKHNYEELV